MRDMLTLMNTSIRWGYYLFLLEIQAVSFLFRSKRRTKTFLFLLHKAFWGAIYQVIGLFVSFDQNRRFQKNFSDQESEAITFLCYLLIRRFIQTFSHTRTHERMFCLNVPYFNVTLLEIVENIQSKSLDNLFEHLKRIYDNLNWKNVIKN